MSVEKLVDATLTVRVELEEILFNQSETDQKLKGIMENS
jgi:hypothetical protein